jgi:hypothetical protein
METQSKRVISQLNPTGNPADRKRQMAGRMLALVAVGQFLGMTLWFSATAAAPRIATELDLTGVQTAWLTIAVQGGFVVGTLVSASWNLADVFNARRLFAIGAIAGASANAAIALTTDVMAVIALRFATGAALACVYPPGMKIVAGWFLERRGTALGIMVGALTLGSAFPHLLAWSASDVPWRTLMLTSSALAVLGGAMVYFAVEDGPYVAPSAPFDPHAIRAVISNRGARLATYGYLGHMWELYAMWAWISAFAAALGAGRALRGMGICRCRRLRAVLGTGDRTHPTHPHRNGPYPADERRFPADHGQHADHSARGRSLRMAVGLRAASARPHSRRHRDETLAANLTRLR